MHHDMECGRALVLDMVQSVNVALINIKKCIHGKLHQVGEPTVPLRKCGIELCDNYSVPL